ncbi:MAG: four helix bundle protein [Bacteroidota bacterium]|nr:four helix bundle protein [Bacteroidota bacterium]
MKKNTVRVFDLEDRLVKFSIGIIDIVEQLPSSRSANHIAGQLIRCVTSPMFNYAEAESAESKKDFIHKMKICLKELRETFVCLQLIHQKRWIISSTIVEKIMDENNEMIAIFVKSIQTAQSRC